MIFFAVLFVTAGVVVLTAINRDTQTTPHVQDTCKPGQVRVNLEVLKPTEVTLNVYNGSTRVGLADQIGNEFVNRGFVVPTKGTVPKGQEYSGIGKTVYGPEAVGAEWLVKAYFLDGALEEHFDPARTGGDVDLILGQEFQQLATTTEVNQRIAALKAPKAPPNTCPGLPRANVAATPGDTASGAPSATA
ncbi:MAG TPA: LytR C-terminal domain-containing protein [Micromonosporaceae bacterium]